MEQGTESKAALFKKALIHLLASTASEPAL
jgi:hypothetical protein